MSEAILVLLTLILLALNVHVHYVFVQSGDPPTIRRTTNGPVEGVQRSSIMGQNYYAFLSIPYAEAPITGIDPYSGKQVDRRFKVRIMA